MSQRSALKAILNGETSPDVCQFEWGYWNETIARWQQEGMPAGVLPSEATGITYYHRVPVATGFFPQFEHQVLEDRERTQIVRDRNGVICEISKTTTALPRYLKHPVKTLEDFEALKPRLLADTPGRYPEHWPAIVSKLAERDSILVMGECEISFFGWHRELMGVENLLMGYYDQPELIHAISEYHLDFLKKFYTPLLKTVDFDFIFMWEDMSFNNGSLISPALIKEFMLPYYKELISYFKGIKDYKVLLDSDGDVHELIPLFIETGVDGMLPFEVAAGMDIREIRKEYPEFIIAGGLDKREIAKGKVAIDRELENKLPFMFAHGRYLPGMDHHVPPEVSYADYQYYLQRTRDIYQTCRSSR